MNRRSAMPVSPGSFLARMAVRAGALFVGASAGPDGACRDDHDAARHAAPDAADPGTLPARSRERLEAADRHDTHADRDHAHRRPGARAGNADGHRRGRADAARAAQRAFGAVGRGGGGCAAGRRAQARIGVAARGPIRIEADGPARRRRRSRLGHASSATRRARRREPFGGALDRRRVGAAARAAGPRRHACGTGGAASGRPRRSGSPIRSCVGTLRPFRTIRSSAISGRCSIPWEASTRRAAWDLQTGSAGVVVGVIDTGTLPHSELAGRVLPGYDFISDPAEARDGDARDPNPRDEGDWNDEGDCGGAPAEPSDVARHPRVGNHRGGYQ